MGFGFWSEGSDSLVPRSQRSFAPASASTCPLTPCAEITQLDAHVPTPEDKLTRLVQAEERAEMGAITAHATPHRTARLSDELMGTEGPRFRKFRVHNLMV